MNNRGLKIKKIKKKKEYAQPHCSAKATTMCKWMNAAVLQYDLSMHPET